MLGPTGWAGHDHVIPSPDTGSSPSPSLGGPTTESGLSDEGCPAAEMMQLVNILPRSVRATLQQHPQMASLVEIVMDLGRVPFARFAAGEAALSSEPVSAADLEEAVTQVTLLMPKSRKP